ncbi:MAG: hypothetical protein QM758_07250 [Armatimonas sp.]
MLSFVARTYADMGDVNEAMRCCLDGMELGITAPRGGSVISALVGCACESIAQKPAWNIADRLDAKSARAAALRMEAVEAKRWPLIEAVDVDRQENNRFYLMPAFHNGNLKKTWDNADFDFDLMESDFSDYSEETPPRGLAIRAQNFWNRVQVVYYGPKTVQENSEKWMAATRDYAKLPWGPARPEIPKPADPLNRIVRPFFPEAEFKDVHIRAQSALLRAYLALHAYRLEKGSYPSSLNALVTAGYLKAVPIDPFSPTRAPLCYKPDGTLWSVGPDAKNDDGKPIDMQGKRGYVTIEKKGDFVARVNTW